MIVSDHGFHSWRKAVNLNTWLVQQGYMVLQGQQPRREETRRPVRRRRVLGKRGLEPHARVCHGPRPIYFNLRGREGKGIVSPGAEARQLADELSARLLTVANPDDGSSIVHAVYPRDDVYAGEYFRIGDELAARFPLRPAGAAETRRALAAEADATRELRACTRFPVPEPVAIGEPGTAIRCRGRSRPGCRARRRPSRIPEPPSPSRTTSRS